MQAKDQQVLEEPAEESERRKYGTFGGVFTPTLLTILGVIMYLREGWVIGNAGILGGLLIIVLAFGITAFTGLAMSSITTNIRIGAGGAYAIIAQSLGLEVGGSVGIPRYLSQALAVTMYVFGFREGWRWVFPEHPALIVDIGAFILLFAIAYKSAQLAIRVQYVIMAVIIGSLVSIALAAANGSMIYEVDHVGWWGTFPGSPENGFTGTTFWHVFAIFFPASTGIMAGANMSGDLRNPRRAIPIGTMAAIGVSLVVYVLLAYWLARSATTEELVSNYTIMMEKAFWGPIVLAGLLGATFSSALASAVGAARILQALGDHRILPGSAWLARVTPIGEPRNAMIVTGLLVMATLFLRDLNAVAPLITMFYLITYAMINAALLIEQSLDLVSFRPLLRVPRSIPLLGLAGSLFVMFIISPIFSLVSVAIVVAFYVMLARRHLEPPFEDVRSGLFVSLAEWAAKKVTELPTMQERAWEPNLLVPVEAGPALRGTFEVIESIAYPKGSVKILGVQPGGASGTFEEELLTLTRAFRDRGIFSSWTILDAGGFTDGLIAGVQALRGAFFRPNVLFLNLPQEKAHEEDYRKVIREAGAEQLGILLYAPHPVARLGQRQYINVWMHDRSPDWRLSMDIGNLDLSILTAYKLKENWDAQLRIITVIADEQEQGNARDFMHRLMDGARLPDTEVVVATGQFDRFIPEAPQADLNIFGLLPDPDFDFIHRMVRETRATCMFVRDSGQESALA